MKKIHIAFIIPILLSLAIVPLALAQTDQLKLNLSRDWGYGGLNGDIQGLFSMRVKGPANLVRVEYYIDGTKIGEVNQSPFNLQFTTDDYSLGIHNLYAVGYTAGGQTYRSNVLSANFVPKQSSTKVILPILGVVLVAILLSAIVPLLTRRSKHLELPLGAERNYGLKGGGICPNCHRPYAFPIMSGNLGFSKLAACPFCGRFGLVRIESLSKLREAEKAELGWVQPDNPSEISEEAKLNKEIDDSKYQGL